MHFLKRLVSGVAAGGFVFGLLYVGARYDIQWIVGLLVLAVAYPSAIEYLRMMKRLDI